MMKNETQKNNEQKVSWWDQRKPGVFYNKSGFPALYPTNGELVWSRIGIGLVVIGIILAIILPILDPNFMNGSSSEGSWHFIGKCWYYW